MGICLLLNILIAMVFISGCTDHRHSDRNSIQNKPDEAVFITAVSSENYKHGIPDFYYIDSLGSGQGNNLYLGKDTARLSIGHPVILIQADDLQTPFLVYPGDTVFVSFDTAKAANFFMPQHVNRNNELIFFKTLIQKTGILYKYEFDDYFGRKVKNTEALLRFYQLIEQKENDRIALLNAAKQNMAISDRFYILANSIIHYTAANDKLYAIANNMKMLQQNGTYRQVFDSCINEVVQIPFSANYMCYRTLTGIVNVAIGGSLYKSVSDVADLDQRMDFIMSHFTGLQKDFLLSNLLAQAVVLLHLTLPQNTLHQYDSACADTTFKKLFHRETDHQVTFSNGSNEDELLLSDFKTKKTIQQIIHEGKGKMILLDFWASWCAPCRREIPYLKKIEAKYSKSRIVFYSISLDEKIDNWKRAMNEEGMADTGNYLFIDPSKSSFLKKYDIGFVPRYILIGRDGKVVAAEAPRPSDKALQDLIEKNL